MDESNQGAAVCMCARCASMNVDEGAASELELTRELCAALGLDPARVRVKGVTSVAEAPAAAKAGEGTPLVCRIRVLRRPPGHEIGNHSGIFDVRDGRWPLLLEPLGPFPRLLVPILEALSNIRYLRIPNEPEKQKEK